MRDTICHREGTGKYPVPSRRYIEKNADLAYTIHHIETSQMSPFRLIAPFADLTLEELDDFPEICYGILAENPNFEVGRAEKIAMAVERRIERAQEILEQAQGPMPGSYR